MKSISVKFSTFLLAIVVLPMAQPVVAGDRWQLLPRETNDLGEVESHPEQDDSSLFLEEESWSEAAGDEDALVVQEDESGEVSASLPGPNPVGKDRRRRLDPYGDIYGQEALPEEDDQLPFHSEDDWDGVDHGDDNHQDHFDEYEENEEEIGDDAIDDDDFDPYESDSDDLDSPTEDDDQEQSYGEYDDFYDY